MNQPERIRITQHESDLMVRQLQRIANQEGMLDILRASHKETLDTLLLNQSKKPGEIGKCELLNDVEGPYLMCYPKPEGA